MGIEIYRAYNTTTMPVQPEQFWFSIISDENSATYALPAELAEKMWFNQDRMDTLLEIAKKDNRPLPTTPLDWAKFASEDMWAWTVLPYPLDPEDDPMETIQQAAELEIVEAEYALSLRKEYYDATGRQM